MKMHHLYIVYIWTLKQSLKVSFIIIFLYTEVKESEVETIDFETLPIIDTAVAFSGKSYL